MANPVDIYVGSRLRMRRTMLGLSQNKIGEMIGVTFQQIQKYEKGINRMGSSRLYQFARILFVPISYFFDGYEDEQNCTLPEKPKSLLLLPMCFWRSALHVCLTHLYKGAKVPLLRRESTARQKTLLQGLRIL